ncbi:MAG: hypothetical protein KGI29_03765 [Pseudomonadota bacterium]|nr:hypothetical protein [Pseudomonadota bacterium]MDE3038583.1 hypothetical protein [Pseudomonadota bacterium]
MRPTPPNNEPADPLLKRMSALAPEQRTEVQDFIEFLLEKKRRHPAYGEWTEGELRQLSEQSLKRGWEPEDSIYDDL